ncbi:hypothetical protein ADUPG1_013169 [Aduncisulcus paluster]|uniref:Protein kinase domain-containing protein n=1 Tax=Aduncisulcus paluster TaxID=2918883 RepID=A0ABQ5K405_9EUKA|nr:hypothetical protein ADUPG1_013169 [Aduncisulcus paluster]
MSVLITIIMIGGDLLINMVVGAVYMIKETSHALASIGHPLFMSIFTLFDSFFVVSSIALWISKADWKMALTSTILALFFAFFEVCSVIGFFDKSSSGFVKLFGDAFFESIATSIFALLWMPMLILPIFYDFVFSESYSLHPLCWASVCLGIPFLVLMISGWKVYRDKHSKTILLMDLLVSFASTALVAGLWLCHDQALEISLMVLGGIGLVVFVVLLIYTKCKKHLPISSVTGNPKDPCPTHVDGDSRLEAGTDLPKDTPISTTASTLSISSATHPSQALKSEESPLDGVSCSNLDPISDDPAKVDSKPKIPTKLSVHAAISKPIEEFKSQVSDLECEESIHDHEFAKLWCVNRTSRASDEEDSDSQRSIDEEDSSYTSSSDDDIYPSESDRISPDSYDPFKIASICVAAIECLDDVQREIEVKKREKFAHRDIKPENFLVPIDPKTNECRVVLGDLGLVKLQDSVLHSSSSLTSSEYSVSKGDIDKKEKVKDKKERKTICGTLNYNSPQALRGYQDAKSDAYSLGMTMFTLFDCEAPFMRFPEFQLKVLPDITMCPIFKNLRESPQGGVEVADCLAEVFVGLTELDSKKRMSVHEAREAVQKIKPFLPRFGLEVKCPSIEEIVQRQLKKYKYDKGEIVDKRDVVAVIDAEIPSDSELIVPKWETIDSKLEFKQIP